MTKQKRPVDPNDIDALVDRIFALRPVAHARTAAEPNRTAAPAKSGKRPRKN